MFETRLQTYWADADPAGRVFFPHFFRFVECAEEELFRAGGWERMQLLEQHGVLMPRVEAHARFKHEIVTGAAILVQLRNHFKGEKTVRMDFAILAAADRTLLAEGYVTIVCMSTATRKSCPIPPAVRAGYAQAEVTVGPDNKG